jgi:nucleoside-diphosphate-sugar epimerase
MDTVNSPESVRGTPRPRPRRYLVTGGFGYAGSWISEYLASQGHQVFVLSRRSGAAGAAWPCTLISADL